MRSMRISLFGWAVSPALILYFLLPLPAVGADGGAIDGADTAWLLISTALVMLMIPGLALFYGGMVRGKNVLSTMMHSMFAMGVVSIQWLVIGYSLSFGPDIGHIIGGTKFFFLRGVGLEANGTVPHLLFMMFQGMFAIITVALISGAYAERLKFSSYVVFTLLWTTLVYDPIAHWVWSEGGWLLNLGALDFAGGTVVHISSGVSALAFAVIIRPRLGYPHEPMMPNNLVFTTLGAALLWFGWFGFNAGSALSAGGTAALAFTTTHMAAAAAAFSWAAAEWVRAGKPSMLGFASGIIAGLVAVTPAAGFISPVSALFLGLVAGVVCHFAVLMKRRFKYDDSLDVFGIHGVGGMLGALATGLLATTVLNPNGADGLFYGNAKQFGIQAIAVAGSAAYAFCVSWILIKFIDKTMGLIVTEDDEVGGLDLALHGERGYSL